MRHVDSIELQLCSQMRILLDHSWLLLSCIADFWDEDLHDLLPSTG